MKDILSNILSYLDYLNNDCKLRVSIHFDQDIFHRLPRQIVSALLPYNCHTNAYCIMAKSLNHHKCLLNQKQLLTACQKGNAFCSVCHAQVYEYIYPVSKNDSAVGFIAVSGYRPTSPTAGAILNRELWENALNPQLPLALCDAVIPPLCMMTEQLLSAHLRESCDEYHLILQYLNEYHTNITLTDLTKHFNRSASHISHLFKKENGMSIRAYCNDLKLEDAKKLLLQTDSPVTEIAFDVGFHDASYFIFLFKQRFGLSPLQYRRKTHLCDP